MSLKEKIEKLRDKTRMECDCVSCRSMIDAYNTVLKLIEEEVDYKILLNKSLDAILLLCEISKTTDEEHPSLSILIKELQAVIK